LPESLHRRLGKEADGAGILPLRAKHPLERLLHRNSSLHPFEWLAPEPSAEQEQALDPDR
jgi:hypothetical protein